MARYDESLALPEALSQHYAASGFPADGGNSSRWVPFRIGPLPLAIPNFDARRRTVRYHDVHHVLTGYDTDWSGEFEISAWEIASGCARHWVAWLINLSALAGGALLRPRRTFRAWCRGRRSRNLYRSEFEPLLGETVGTLRRRLALPPRDAAFDASWMDRTSFAFWSVVGALESTLPIWLGATIFALW